METNDLVGPGAMEKRADGWYFMGLDYEWTRGGDTRTECEDAARRAGLTPWS